MNVNKNKGWKEINHQKEDGKNGLKGIEVIRCRIRCCICRLSPDTHHISVFPNATPVSFHLQHFGLV